MPLNTQEFAPDFQLKDYKGELIQLSGFQNKKNILLVFNRGFF